MDKETQRKLDLLAALQAGGVENWEGYDLATKEHRKAIDREEKAENIVDDMFSALAKHIKYNSYNQYYITDEGRDEALRVLLSRAKDLCE